jgi:hypothetical protein
MQFPVNVPQLVSSRPYRAEEGDFVLVRVIELRPVVSRHARVTAKADVLCIPPSPKMPKCKDAHQDR